MINISNMSIREKAYILIRDAIIDGILRPRERLIEDNLASEYNVSRTPLREAIHKLELDGFLQRLPKRGLVVADLSIKEVGELYQVRSYLEGLATNEFTKNILPANYRLIEGLKKDMFIFKKNGEQDKVLESCKQLHKIICENCGHSICMDYIGRMEFKIKRYRNQGVKQVGRTDQAYIEHINIIDSILAGDSSAADILMRNHVMNSGNVAKEAIKEYIRTVE